MRRRLLQCAFALVSLGAGFAVGPGQAADLVWEVESPFRFFKSANSYALHAKAFGDVRGNPAAPLPADIVWRLERRLNDPDCRDATTPTSCAATARSRYETVAPRLGGADGRRGLLRECRQSAALSGAVRAQIFLGCRERRLHSARGPHRQHRPVARAAGTSRRRRVHVELAAARGRGAQREPQAILQEQADHRARAVCARSRRLGG